MTRFLSLLKRFAIALLFWLLNRVVEVICGTIVITILLYTYDCYGYGCTKIRCRSSECVTHFYFFLQMLGTGALTSVVFLYVSPYLIFCVILGFAEKHLSRKRVSLFFGLAFFLSTMLFFVDGILKVFGDAAYYMVVAGVITTTAIEYVSYGLRYKEKEVDKT